jgi:hypothetical protein
MHNTDVQQTGFCLIALENKTTVRNLTFSYVIKYFLLTNFVGQGPSPQLPELLVNTVMTLWILDQTSHYTFIKKDSDSENYIK